MKFLPFVCRDFLSNQTNTNSTMKKQVPVQSICQPDRQFQIPVIEAEAELIIFQEKFKFHKCEISNRSKKIAQSSKSCSSVHQHTNQNQYLTASTKQKLPSDSKAMISPDKPQTIIRLTFLRSFANSIFKSVIALFRISLS